MKINKTTLLPEVQYLQNDKLRAIIERITSVFGSLVDQREKKSNIKTLTDSQFLRLVVRRYILQFQCRAKPTKEIGEKTFVCFWYVFVSRHGILLLLEFLIVIAKRLPNFSIGFALQIDLINSLSGAKNGKMKNSFFQNLLYSHYKYHKHSGNFFHV